MKKRLAGTRSWDPTGESFWGVLAKLCARNHMSWDEGRSVLGNRLDRSVVSEAGRNPDEITNVCIDRICELTGWSDQQVRSGFSEFYQPYWMRDRPRAVVPLCSSIRLCHECAAAGIHLTVHQFHDWTHCPVHKQRLRGTCPKCGEELGHFQLTGDFPQRSLCYHCHWALWTSNREIESDQGEARRQFVADYVQWQQDIETTFCGDTQKCEWLGQPSRYGQLAHVHALIPGPACVPRCLVNARRVVARHLWYFRIENLENEELFVSEVFEQSLLDFGDSSEFDRASEPEKTYLDRLRNTIHMEYLLIRDRHDSDAYHSGVRELSSKHLMVQQDLYTSYWTSAHWLWRRCFDDAWPRDQKWSRLRQPTSILSTELGRQWRRAFSQYFSAHDSAPGDTHGQFTKILLSKYWLKAWLESAFYGFAALSCHATDTQVLNSDDLAAHLQELGTLPLFVLKHVNANRFLTTLTTMKNEQYFVDLKVKKTEENTTNKLTEFSQLRPLLEGVGLHPDTVRQWKRDGDRVRTRLDRMKKR